MKKKKREKPLLNLIMEMDKLRAMKLNKQTGEDYQLRVDALFKKIINEIQNTIKNNE